MPANVKSVFEKIKGLINKLPFNNLAAKVPALAKISSYANYAFCALLVLLILVIAIPKGVGKNSAYIGTWVYTYDGKDGGDAFVEFDDSFATRELILYKDGTFLATWVAHTYRNDYKMFTNGIAYRVKDYGSGDGDWSIDDGKLIFEYTKGNRVESPVEIDEKGRVLKFGAATYYKKLH